MTSIELKQKLEDSNVKVEKREKTMTKICGVLGVNFQELKNQLEREFDYNKSFFSYAQAKEIIDTYTSIRNDVSEQLIDNVRKYFELKKINNNWQDKYNTQLQKEESPKNEVIMNFLNNWEINARNWYVENSKYLVKEMNRHHKEIYDMLVEDNYFSMSFQEQREYRGKFSVKFTSMNKWLKENESIGTMTVELSNIMFKCKDRDDCSYDSNFGYFSKEGGYELISFDLDTLNKRLAQEKERKYIDLIKRIKEKVGEIIDATNLSIGNQKGELNGIIKGTKGDAKIETISAGGYNIQCFHYRVLVHKI